MATGLDLVKQDIRKYANNYMRHLATILGEEMVDATRDIIQEFYKDYDPVRYRRHYYNLENQSFRRYYSNRHGGRTHVCGVQFTPELMDDLYVADTDQVLSSVLDGFHGLPYENGVDKKTQKPWEKPVGYGYYNFGGYDYGHTEKVGQQRLAIKRMSPTPLELLEAKRDELVENIDKYSDQAMELALKDGYKFIM